MRVSRKTLMLAMCLLSATAVTVGGTLAYLTDRDFVQNTFTVGKVDIRLDEAEIGPDGQTPTGNRTQPGADGAQANRYQLMPGRTVPKDPTITVEEGSEPAYVRMLVTLNCLSVWTEACGADFSFAGDFLSGRPLAGGWQITSETAANDALTVEIRYEQPVGAGQSVCPFDQVTIPQQLTAAQAAALGEGFAIDIAGHAIQAETFADPQAAWAAFDSAAPAAEEGGEQ